MFDVRRPRLYTPAGRGGMMATAPRSGQTLVAVAVGSNESFVIAAAMRQVPA